ncbi:MAG TPA: 2-C-methyl-D-erythritol 4-phosphate cytidylyltransferase [Alphaproteobacteria bacterium]|jgi:2-C-methyl-D-erythritol 4-phosphate cytidylyltransferase|nr:2-C-methyl-D-erythritol 4-phosphate cytidylyltransferase [Alphaproteobacteria bacterium]
MTAASLPAPRNVAALILGAGSGARMGNLAKAFLETGGTTLLRRAVELVRPYCGEILAGVRAGDVERGSATVADLGAKVTAGGATRQETLAILLSRATKDFVVVHDVARPFAAARLFETVLAAAGESGAASVFLPASRADAIGLAEGEEMIAPLPRENVVFTQTPQAYRRDWLLDAYRQAEAQGWEEQSTTGLVTRAGYRIRLVPGDSENIKITYSEDWESARARLPL